MELSKRCPEDFGEDGKTRLFCCFLYDIIFERMDIISVLIYSPVQRDIPWRTVKIWALYKEGFFYAFYQNKSNA